MASLTLFDLGNLLINSSSGTSNIINFVTPPIGFNNSSKTLAKSSFKLYKKLVDLTIKDISITTTSLYTKNLIVKNDTGTVNTENAFFPFGPQAKKNAKLKIKAEEWIGKNITQAVLKMDWKDLPESFATHYSKRFMREVLGEDEYQWAKRKEQISSLKASLKNDLPVAHSGSGSSRHYPKGSFVIDMLRYVVGEEEYNKTLQN